MYVNNYEFGHGYTIGGIPKLRELIRQRVNISAVKPEVFAIVNRPIGKGRCFENIEELRDGLNNNTRIDEGKKWEIIDGMPGNKNLTQLAFLWATFKILVAPSGSMIYNNVFMHEGTGMCLLFTGIIDYPNIHLSIASNIFMIGVIHTGYTNLFRGSPVNVKNMTKYAQRVVDAVKNNKWMDMEGLRTGFDEDSVRKYYDDDIGKEG